MSMSEKTQLESSSTIQTTASMKKKAKLLSRCFITLLKCWTFCKKPKKTEKNTISV